jgi:hypothetical protein
MNLLTVKFRENEIEILNHRSMRLRERRRSAELAQIKVAHDLLWNKFLKVLLHSLRSPKKARSAKIYHRANAYTAGVCSAPQCAIINFESRFDNFLSLFLSGACRCSVSSSAAFNSHFEAVKKDTRENSGEMSYEAMDFFSRVGCRA